MFTTKARWAGRNVKGYSPNNSPIASCIPFLTLLIEEYTEKMSGAPFPKARKVTPATLWLNLRMSDIVLKDGQKLYF